MYNSLKIFVRWVFSPQISGVESKKMSITVLVITEELCFSVQFQKNSVYFSCLKKITVAI